MPEQNKVAAALVAGSGLVKHFFRLQIKEA
jgi:hypothetical protein